MGDLLTLEEWILNHSILRQPSWSDKAEPCPKPWSWIVSFEDLVYEEPIRVVIVGEYENLKKEIWTSIGTKDLPKSVRDRINYHLGLLGFAVEDKAWLLYPNQKTGFFFEKNGKPYPCYSELANYFKSELKVKNDDTYRCIFEDGYYRDMSHIELSNLIDKLTNDQASSAHHDAFKKKIVSRCFFPKDNFQSPDGFINLKNGILEIKERKLLAHNHDFNFRYRLEHEYIEGAQAPNFIEFLKFIFEDNMDLVYLIGEIMGYTLAGGDPIAHKAFIFYGDGANGKSTLLDIIKHLLGEKAVSSVSMDRLKEPFSMVRMDGKLANIVEETPSSIASDVFKAIVGGGTVAAARKHMDEYDMKVKARMFFACNDYPHFKDSSEGLKRRLVIIPFNRFIKPDERDYNIKEKLLEEMPGILNFAIKGYERFKDQGNKFTQVDSVDESVKDYMGETDSVSAWAQEAVTLSMQATDRVLRDTVFDSYKAFCKENGFQTCNNITFGKRFKRYLASTLPDGYNADDISLKNNGKRFYIFMKVNGKTDIFI